MTFEEVKAWMAENEKDPKVQELLAVMAPKPQMTPDSVREYLDTQEGQKVVQPFVDRKLDQAIQTYKGNHFQQEVKAQVAAELLKLNPQETPEQRRLREVEEKLSQSEKDRARDHLKRQMVEEASKIGVDAFFIDDYLPASLDEGKLFLSKVKQYVEAREAKKANEILTSGGFKPGAGDGKGVDPSKMSSKERQAHYVAEAEKRMGLAQPAQ